MLTPRTSSGHAAGCRPTCGRHAHSRWKRRHGGDNEGGAEGDAAPIATEQRVVTLEIKGACDWQASRRGQHENNVVRHRVGYDLKKLPRQIRISPLAVIRIRIEPVKCIPMF